MAGMRLLGFNGTINEIRSLQNQVVGENADAIYIVGTNVEYAAFVEFGTSRMEAQPYLRRAAEEVASNPAAHVGTVDGIGDFVKKVALAIERLAKQYSPVDTGNLKASIKAEKMR